MGLNEKFFKSAVAGDTPSFATVIYSGNDSTRNITVGFQPDLIITKCRSTGYSHMVTDSVRGGSENLRTNTNGAKETLTTLNFQSNGYQIVWGGESNSDSWNSADDTFVAWCWRAGGSASDITSSSSSVSVSKRSANVEAGFSIVTYTINATTQVVLPHGLDSTPKLAIVKKLDSPGDWLVYNTVIANKGRGFLNNSNAFDNSSMPTLDSTNITFLAQDPFDTGNSAVIYFFADIPGYQKIGSYTGSRPNTKTVYTTDNGQAGGANGFRPRFLFIKDSQNSGEDWLIVDSLREGASAPTKALYPSNANTEDSYTVITFTSNGFTVGNTGLANTNGATIIYLAIA